MAGVSEWLALAIADRLFAASLQGAVVIAIVWLVCRCIRDMPASAHAALWWLASLKLMLLLAPVPAVHLPLLPPDDAGGAVGAAPIMAVDGPDETAGPGPTADAPAMVVDAGEPAAPAARDWRTGAAVVLVAVWLLVVAAHAVRLARALRVLRGIAGRAVPLVASGEIADLAAVIGLAAPPEVRVSEEVGEPQVAGVRRPLVLLPAALSALPPREWRLALAHEMAHVRRRDLALGWVPALAERLFFFHPLARLAAREYLTAREAACDAAVVRALGVGAGEYGRLLLRLGIARAEPALAATGASASASSLRRRLEMLQHAASARIPRRSAWLVVVLLALATVPFELVAGASSSQAPGVLAPVEPVSPAAGPQPAPVPAALAPAWTPPVAPASPAPAALPLAARQPAPESRAVAAPAPGSAAPAPLPVATRVRPAPASVAVTAAPARPARAAAPAVAVPPQLPAPAAGPAPVAAPVAIRSRAVVFAGNQEPGSTEQRDQTAAALAEMAAEFEALRRRLETERSTNLAEQQAQIEQLRRALAEAERAVEEAARRQAEAELASRLEATLAEPAPQRAQQEVERRATRSNEPGEPRRVERAAAADSTAALARQLQTLARQQQSLIEQQQTLARQQERIAQQQQQMSEQMERLRQALERAATR
jgi:beta-lactamase regulating signal transducer with metallopeptidase domain